MDLIRELWDEYGRLTATQKRVVFEMYWNGYTEAEAAETLGLHRNTVSRILSAAQKKIAERMVQKGEFKALSVVRKNNGDSSHGNGQRPDKPKAPVSDGPPASFCPPPDIYLGSPARDAFIKELSWIAASPFLQLQGRGGYNRRAKANRERIARDREAERAARMAA